MTISSTETQRPTTESMVTAAIPSGLKGSAGSLITWQETKNGCSELHGENLLPELRTSQRKNQAASCAATSCPSRTWKQPLT
jgi:hypothetical protein